MSNIVPFTQYIRLLKDSLKQEPLHRVLKDLEAQVKEASSLKDEARSLVRRTGRMLEDRNKGHITWEQYEVNENRLLEATFQLIDQLTEKDVQPHDKKVNLLVICREEESKEEMQHYLARFDLPHSPGKEVIVMHEYRYTDPYQVIIFDNRSLKPAVEQGITYYPNEGDMRRLELMEAYIKGTSAYILHIGPKWEEMDKYREQVYAANSIFAFHARLKELIHYIRDLHISPPEEGKEEVV